MLQNLGETLSGADTSATAIDDDDDDDAFQVQRRCERKARLTRPVAVAFPY